MKRQNMLSWKSNKPLCSMFKVTNSVSSRCACAYLDRNKAGLGRVYLLRPLKSLFWQFGSSLSKHGPRWKWWKQASPCRSMCFPCAKITENGAANNLVFIINSIKGRERPLVSGQILTTLWGLGRWDSGGRRSVTTLVQETLQWPEPQVWRRGTCTEVLNLAVQREETQTDAQQRLESTGSERVPHTGWAKMPTGQSNTWLVRWKQAEHLWITGSGWRTSVLIVTWKKMEGISKGHGSLPDSDSRVLK